jgi:hypothetical protein
VQHRTFLASTVIDQKDIQEVQDDFCKGFNAGGSQGEGLSMIMD